jgi:serine phosphatase RsbU (regulator of sigma subunit)
MKIKLLIIVLVFILTGHAVAQPAVYPVRNFTTRDYGRNFHPSNLAIMQDKNGIIYAANGFKLLEYDGHSWESYPINKETWILSIDIDPEGIIYAGSQQEFGWFIPDSSGLLTYHSLSDSLEAKDLDFTNIWKVSAFSGGVAFQSEEKLFICNQGKITVINPETSFHTSFSVNGDLYVRERGNGLLLCKNNNLVRIPRSEIFDTTGIFMMAPFGINSSKILIGTRDKGFWTYDNSNESAGFKRFNIEDQALIDRSGITGGSLAANGLFALSTSLNGVILVDSAGKIRSVINKEYGLTDNDVRQVISDRSGNLWLATNNGLSMVEISSPLSFYSDISGLPGTVTSIFRYNGLLYAGTNAGLFRQVRDKPFFENASLPLPVRSLAEAGNSLFIGTDNGLLRMKANSAVRAGDKDSYALYYSPSLNLLFSGGSGGLSVFRPDGSPLKRDLAGINDDIIGLAGENFPAGDSIKIWIGTRYNGIIRLIVRKDLSCVHEGFTVNDGLPGGPVTPFSLESNIVFGTSEGLFAFTDESSVKKSLPDSLKNNRDFTRGYFVPFALPGEYTGKSVTALIKNAGKIWLSSDNHPAYIDTGKDFKYTHQPFDGIDAGRIEVIYPEKNGMAWFGTTDGLIRYEETSKDYNIDFECLVRKVKLTDNDSIVFAGTYTDQTSFYKPVLPFNNNSVRIEFSAPFFEYPGKIRYAWRLNDSKWSQWKNENFSEFTDLREGKYIFTVKAVNVYGKESRPSVYEFRILPPWYRSVPAFIVYAVLGIALIWLIAWANSYRLKRENIKLEGIVADRTSEVVRQKNEIVEKNKVLEVQKKEIEDSIRYAGRIQKAVIPDENHCLNILPESFIFFRPLNIVSGDFYWIGTVENKIIFTAADCTGHGVPGAFMSMLGVAFLNEIVNKDHITQPDIILNNLRTKVIQALQHKGSDGEAKDGMDISMVCIDNKAGMLQYAGAYNPLIMIRDGEIREFAGDKMPVGTHERMDPFSRHEIAIRKGDVLYLASDGYEDQFGGPDGKKLKAKKFKQLLLEIHKIPMNQQKVILEKHFEEWRGELRQVDDVIVAGISVS